MPSPGPAQAAPGQAITRRDGSHPLLRGFPGEGPHLRGPGRNVTLEMEWGAPPPLRMRVLTPSTRLPPQRAGGGPVSLRSERMVSLPPGRWNSISRTQPLPPGVGSLSAAPPPEHVPTVTEGIGCSSALNRGFQGVGHVGWWDPGSPVSGPPPIPRPAVYVSRAKGTPVLGSTPPADGWFMGPPGEAAGIRRREGLERAARGRRGSAGWSPPIPGASTEAGGGPAPSDPSREHPAPRERIRPPPAGEGLPQEVLHPRAEGVSCGGRRCGGEDHGIDPTRRPGGAVPVKSTRTALPSTSNPNKPQASGPGRIPSKSSMWSRRRRSALSIPPGELRRPTAPGDGVGHHPPMA